MIVSAWKGGTLGIRVGMQNACKFFDRSSKSVMIDIDGDAPRDAQVVAFEQGLIPYIPADQAEQ